MKKFLPYGIFSFLISCFTLALYHFSGWGNKTVVLTQSPGDTPAVETSMPTITLDQLTSAPPDFRLSAQATLPAVVHIKAFKTSSRRRSSIYEELFGFGPSNRRQNVSTGSGVVMTEDGFIVTNNHVIESADELEVTFYDNRTYKATVIGTDPTTDLGVIKVDDRDLQHVNFANSDEVSVGEWVLAVGNPFNLASTATAGIVSAIGRDLDIIQNEMSIESFIQTDAAVNPGNSGGALVNLKGELVGVNTAIASPTGAYAGYAFAVPANIVEKVVEDIRQYGAVQRGFIGIYSIIEINPNIAEELELGVQEGILVDKLTSRSAAAKAGINEGDIIVSIDNNRINNRTRLQELIGRKRPGDYVAVKVYRKGDYLDFPVQLTTQDGTTEIQAGGKDELLTELGVEFEDVDKRTLYQYRVENGVRISKLYAGRFRSQTEVEEGFIILTVNGKKVYSSAGLLNMLKETRGRVSLEGFYPGRRYIYQYEINM